MRRQTHTARAENRSGIEAVPKVFNLASLVEPRAIDQDQGPRRALSRRKEETAVCRFDRGGVSGSVIAESRRRLVARGIAVDFTEAAPRLPFVLRDRSVKHLAPAHGVGIALAAVPGD